MAPSAVSLTPNLASFIASLNTEAVENSTELLIGLLKRRQIRGSKTCAEATARLLRRVIALTRASDATRLIQRIQDVGKRLVIAQPQELVIGNIVRRVTGLIREVEEENRGGDDLSGLSSEAGSEPATPYIETQSAMSFPPSHSVSPPRAPSKNTSPTRPPLISSHTGPVGTRQVTSMFSILSHPAMKTSGASTPVRSGAGTPQIGGAATSDLRAEVVGGMSELIDELNQSDDQIANYALDHIHAGEIIFTYSASLTVQRFLLKAAKQRNFTVVHAEAYPNSDSVNPDDQMPADVFQKPLTAAGVNVILVPDSAIFALMSRANKVIIDTHAVLSNGSLVAAAGTKMVAKAAQYHRVPVIVLCGTYKLSPKYPYDSESYLEYGDVGKVVSYQDVGMRQSEMITVENPLSDFVDGECVDLFVTNLGGCATGSLYRLIRDQYGDEDADL